MEYRLRRFDGAYRVVRDMGAARCDENGAFAGYVDACMDVTDLVAPQPTEGHSDEAGAAGAS
jgi:two-component system CheB/CheR fusion protein